MKKAVFDENRCKGCGLCVEACPRKLVDLDKHRLNRKGYHPATCTDAERCNGCGLCAMMCPDTAITVED